MNACHKDSDIDLFIITRKNRLWSVRIFLTLILSILGQRKTTKKHAGKFCLSFFITEDALSLEHIAIENDVYLEYWVETLKPILNRNKCFEKFMKKNKNLLEGSLHTKPHHNSSPQGEDEAQFYSPLIEEMRIRGEVLYEGKT